MKKVITLTESDLVILIKRIVNENGVNKSLIFEEDSEKLFNSLVKVIYDSRENTWNSSTKFITSNRQDIAILCMELVNWVKKNKSFDPNLLIATICIILRESKGTSFSFAHPKEIGGAIMNFFGGDSSQGYGQVKPSVAKSYGIDPSQFDSMYGSIDGVYRMLLKNYESAKKYYSGNFITKNINGKYKKESALNNDAALHMAIAVHNGGLGILGNWCETNLPTIANKCNINSRQPYPEDQKDLWAITNKKKPIQNYFPKKGSLYSYMPEVIQNFKSFSTVPSMLNTLSNMKTINIGIVSLKNIK
jgi:hypothetical protein